MAEKNMANHDILLSAHGFMGEWPYRRRRAGEIYTLHHLIDFVSIEADQALAEARAVRLMGAFGLQKAGEFRMDQPTIQRIRGYSGHDGTSLVDCNLGEGSVLYLDHTKQTYESYEMDDTESAT